MIALVRIALVLMLFAVPRHLAAQESLEHQHAKAPHFGTGLVCDSPQQVQRILALHGDGTSVQLAMEKVNLESQNPTACAIAVTAFVENEEISTVAVPNGVIRLVQIVVFATMGDNGWQRVPGAVRYTAVFVKTESA